MICKREKQQVTSKVSANFNNEQLDQVGHDKKLTSHLPMATSNERGRKNVALKRTLKNASGAMQKTVTQNNY